MSEITIKALTPELIEDYFDFFDNRAFSDGSPYYPCYCNAFNLSLEQLKRNVFDKAPEYGEGKEGLRLALRASAWKMVQGGTIQGYLAYDNEIAVGWCNANDRLNYYRVGEFDIDDAPEDSVPSDCPSKGFIKSVVCFEISPEYRGQGIAGKLLDRVCKDAASAGYLFVEAYPKEETKDSSLSFTGPYKLFKRADFAEYNRNGTTIIMRKALPIDTVGKLG
jgi:GNAT superfamily N-acetyltransferase